MCSSTVDGSAGGAATAGTRTLRIVARDARTGRTPGSVEWFQVTGVDSDLSVGVSQPPFADGAYDYELPTGIYSIALRATGYELVEGIADLRGDRTESELLLQLEPRRGTR